MSNNRQNTTREIALEFFGKRQYGGVKLAGVSSGIVKAFLIRVRVVVFNGVKAFGSRSFFIISICRANFCFSLWVSILFYAVSCKCKRLPFFESFSLRALRFSFCSSTLGML